MTIFVLGLVLCTNTQMFLCYSCVLCYFEILYYFWCYVIFNTMLLPITATVRTLWLQTNPTLYEKE